MKKLLLLIASTFLILISACSRNFDGSLSSPLIYKIDIQQGNAIEQKMLAKIKVGMDKKQVKFILGTPLLIDPFRNDRWDYIYSLQKNGVAREQRLVTLHFKDSKLSYLSGDIKNSAFTINTEDDIVTENQAIIVPKKQKKTKGFFNRLWNKIIFLD